MEQDRIVVVIMGSERFIKYNYNYNIMGKYKWGDRTILLLCPCRKQFKSFSSSKRKYCSLECSGKFKQQVSFWKDKQMPKELREKLSLAHKKMWAEGKMDNRKKLLGDLNHSKKQEVKDKIRQTHEATGKWTKKEDLSNWEFYKRNVLLLTDRIQAFKNWNGKCFYCKREIKNEPKWSKFEPTIDHKKSIIYGFNNHIKEEIIAEQENLCISCRSCNCSKRENVR